MKDWENQFLANIREVDAVAHVVRCFDDGNITHVAGKVDPLADIETIETELMLADMASVEKTLVGAQKKASAGDKDAKALASGLSKVQAALEEGQSPRTLDFADDENMQLKQMHLLTMKPVMYVCNVDEGSAGTGNEFSNQVAEYAKKNNAAQVVVFCCN